MSQSDSNKNPLSALLIGVIGIILIVSGTSLVSSNSAKKCESEGKVYDSATGQCRSKTISEMFSEQCTGSVYINGGILTSCETIKTEGLEEAFLDNRLIVHGNEVYEIGTQSEIEAGKNNGDYCLSASDTWSHIGEKRCVVFNYTYLACSNGYCFLDEKQDYKNGFVVFFGKYNMYNWNSFSSTYMNGGPILVCGQIYLYDGHPEIKITNVAAQTRLFPQASMSGSTLVYRYSCN